MGNIGNTEGKDIKNDTQDEIDKIMGEIENLQREMNSTVDEAVSETIVAEATSVESTPEPTVEAEPNVMEEFHAGGDEVGIEETLGALDEEPAQGPTLLDPVTEPVQTPLAEATPIRLIAENVSKGETMAAHDDEKTTREDGCLSMTLTGNMTLKLKYEYEGEEVHIGFSDHALQVQLSDGTEFKIPVNRKTALKRVA